MTVPSPPTPGPGPAPGPVAGGAAHAQEGGAGTSATPPVVVLGVPPLPPITTAARSAAQLTGAAITEATAAIARELGIDPAMLQQFQSEVHMWVELDSTIQRLQAALKERRAAKTLLQQRIMRFMAQSDVNNVTVNSGNVRLRYRVSYVRGPLTHAVIKDRISSYLASNPTVAQALVSSVFARERVERPSLRKIAAPARAPAL